MPFQQSLDWYGELPKKALDDWPTLGKFIFDFNFQDIR